MSFQTRQNRLYHLKKPCSNNNITVFYFLNVLIGTRYESVIFVVVSDDLPWAEANLGNSTEAVANNRAMEVVFLGNTKANRYENKSYLNFFWYKKNFTDFYFN